MKTFESYKLNSYGLTLRLVLLGGLALFNNVVTGAEGVKINKEPSGVNWSILASKVHNPCPINQVQFNEKCRDVKFFQRFLTEGAYLSAVAGPLSQDNNADTGVIVYEIFTNSVVQALFILPDKIEPGQPVIKGRKIRADYPIIAAQSYQIWQNGGYMNAFTANQGSVNTSKGPVFGLQSWTHHVHTLGGYKEFYSDGTSMLAQASTGPGYNYCESASDAAGKHLTAWCGGVSTGLAAAAAISNALFVGGATIMVPTPPVIIAGGAELVLFSAGAGSAGVTAAIHLCPKLGESFEEFNKFLCDSNPLIGVTENDQHFQPFLPLIATGTAVDLSGSCPEGMIKTSGWVYLPTLDQEVTYTDDGEVIVEAKGKRVYLNNTCAIP